MQTCSYKSCCAIIGIIILLAAILFYLLTFHTQSTPSEAELPSFLHVQTAHSGSLTPAPDAESWTLTLYDVSPVTAFFSDRPDRLAGRESTADFVSNWHEGDDSYADDPPNAALDIIGDDDTQHIVTLELLAVRYDSAADKLEYDAIILDGTPDSDAIEMSFGNAALFIDSTYKSYNCSCDPLPGEHTCSCKHSYTLGKSTTKEFRGSCHGSGAPASVKISGKNRSTTCTAETNYGLGYETRSCTNWSPTSVDHIDVTIECRE